MFQAQSETALFIKNGKNISFTEFASNVSHVAENIKNSHPECVLYANDTYLFAVGFFGSLLAGKTIILPQNVQDKTLDELIINRCLMTDMDIGKESYKLKYENIGQRTSVVNINENAEIIFYTSGSTGRPKAIKKRFANLLEEVKELEKIWGIRTANSLFAASVSHQHIYGLLFRLLWPLYKGCKIDTGLTFNAESLSDIASNSDNITFISSPAFLKRMAEEDVNVSVKNIFSSGGALPDNVGTIIKNKLGAVPMEILGSTETGGIAFKGEAGGTWEKFPMVDIKVNENSEMLVKSPYIYENGYIKTGDVISLEGDKFILEGRSDRIIKIEEKRISLDEIEAKLNELPLIKTSHMLLLEKQRQVIGAVIVLTSEGEEQKTKIGSKEFNMFLRKHLLEYFEAVTIPRKWRYVSEIKLNAQGKVDGIHMKSFFIND